jgi:AcrR family transcriptional regulator
VSSREAIVAAAEALFAERGYERATIRAIAARAGVDPATVHHFFPTKDTLLDAIFVRTPPYIAGLAEAMAQTPAAAGQALAETLLELWSSDAARLHVSALLRVAMSTDAGADGLRQKMTVHLVGVLSEHMPEQEARFRAGLVATQIVGLVLFLLVVPLAALTDADRKTIAAAVGPCLQRYLTGDLSEP